MPRYAVFFLVSVGAVTGCEGQPKQPIRPITEAESVLAVYREDSRLASSGASALILAAWPDGHVVWSPPSVAGKTEAGLLHLRQKGFFNPFRP
jgi:hypothetical protein